MMPEKILLKDYAYYRTGGRAKKLYHPDSISALQSAMREIKQQSLPYFLLGGGTNSLVTDEDWPGAVVLFDKLCSLAISDDHLLTVGAGVENSAAAQFALNAGMDGIAWMYGLPGQLGGTVRMNARCYGGEISEVIVQVIAVDEDGQVQVYRDPKIFRGYKDTIFMDNKQAIAEVVIQLRPGDRQAIKEKMEFCKRDREGKGQYLFPSCGCVFKNDYSVGVPSGMLLEHAGLKSLKYKGAEVNPHHANFLFNVKADSRSIIEATLVMRERVYDTFGVWLKYEMEILGRLPADLDQKVKEERPQDFQLMKLNELRERFSKKTR